MRRVRLRVNLFFLWRWPPLQSIVGSMFKDQQIQLLEVESDLLFNLRTVIIMAEPHRQPKIMVSKIYLLKEKVKSSSQPQMLRFNPLTVHLSSAFQSERRTSLNKQMQAFSRRLDSSHHFASFLTERPQTHQQIRSEIQLKRDIHTSTPSKFKRNPDPHSFYISELAEQSWNDSNLNKLREQQEELVKREEQRSKKKNFNLRRMQFNIFIRNREYKKKERPRQEVKQVVYQWEELNKWGNTLKLEDSSHGKYNSNYFRVPREGKEKRRRKIHQGKQF